MTTEIKSMQLYPRAERILIDLRARGLADDAALTLSDLTDLDQLHYHGTEALDVAIDACGIGPGSNVLEIGAGWGGPARYLAATTGAKVTAVELQPDYHDVAQSLTTRAGLSDRITHMRADFLDVPLPGASFTHVVSWLALYHIPKRATYLAKARDLLKPQGNFWAEDLVRLSQLDPVGEAEMAAAMFPNSLVGPDDYARDLAACGFAGVNVSDMTADWRDFTASRLQAFLANSAAYEDVHGSDGRRAIQSFYENVSGYFARGVLGGVRARCVKP
jgi:cyclopropane fatty-acyl-phospholipid synthase-like methyltransferase